MLLVSSSFPAELEPVIKDRDDTREYQIKICPTNDFSKHMALENLSKAFSKNSSIFQPEYEQTVAYSHHWIRQCDSNLENMQLNSFNNAFFDKENQLGVSWLFWTEKNNTG